MEFKENARVYTARDDDLGKIDRIIIDPVADEITHLVVRKGIFLPEEKIVPVSDIATATKERVNLEDGAGFDEYQPFEESHYVAVNTPHAADVSGTLAAEPAIPPLAWYGPYGAPLPPELPYTRTVTARNIPERAVALKPESPVFSKDLDEIGTISEIIANQEGRATHLVINYDVPAPERAIPITFVQRIGESGVHLSVDPSTVSALPPFDRDSYARQDNDQTGDNGSDDGVTTDGGAHGLQRVLGDLVDLTLQIQHVRWNVDDGAETLRGQLDDFDALVRAGCDAIAARLRALGVSPDGRISTVYQDMTYKPLDRGLYDKLTAIRAFTSRLARMAKRMRQAIDAADDTDPESAVVLRSLSDELLTWTNSFEVRV
jgi:starvation-inducible DNA-binding protein